MQSRRHFLTATSSSAMAAALGSPAAAATTEDAAHDPTVPNGQKPVPLLHATDLYRPHNDPDDHWDLACVYALVARGDFDLKAVLIDFPPAGRHLDPDVMAVAQLNYLTGNAAPTLTGAPPSVPGQEKATLAARPETAGVRKVIEILRRSPQPVVINIVGSSRDIALASRAEPRLFAAKCAGVYLNAGSGTRDQSGGLEYNVNLDPANYAAIFQLPCPVYWLPCFEHTDRSRVEEWGTYYSFRHQDVLPHLSDPLQNYFSLMYQHGGDLKGTSTAGGSPWEWLHGLLGQPDAQFIAKLGPESRSMWSTAGMLHAAGLTVTREGQIVPRSPAVDAVFSLDPIRVTCSADGVTHWTPEATSHYRYIFHVRDVRNYASAMTSALTTLLGPLR